MKDGAVDKNLAATVEMSSCTEGKKRGKGEGSRDGADGGSTETNFKRREHIRHMEKRAQISD